ncbi:ABC transporter substrate-binding protein [Fodinicurvata sp. CAU 1616]|uniref:ABC transporter substrate-binding protein n=1 Tax=Aquibaculum arenosum TaxID=3032591 RepID=A0ABT5YRB1_9PROT|nr:ABC transporter substrate-binding protein [Fodinicurvata sp. CAU 1616]
MRRLLLASSGAVVLIFASGSAQADMAAAERWIDEEFQPSSLTREEQVAEMEWFIQAAEPFQGMEINVVAEAIPTHEYEAEVLTQAFEEITGIRVNMQLMGEGDVVQALQTQLQTQRNLYDLYVNDADLIGMHYRIGQTVNLTEWMEGEGADVTNPGLDIDDYFGTASGTAPDGDLYQLPDQQFANLYWFRKDWFDREDLQEQFREQYGYDLGVPRNWSAYEDIAEFFTEHVQEIDGVQVYGHMDYGKRAPDLGWRMTDAWLSMAGAADPGLPNGVPVDEWGIRMEEGTCNPVGASVTRGGATNSRPAVYAVEKWDEWLRNYAPPGASDLDFYQSLPALSQGNVAQQIFWYTAFTANMVQSQEEGNNTVDEEGNLLWRMAPSPVGPYWKEGMQRGYQDVGSWTLMETTPLDRRKAAWLFAQFASSKTVDVKKSHVGITFVRDSTVRHESFSERAPQLGGLIEFYRSPDRHQWTDTGTNVPDYPRLAQLFWQHIGDVTAGTFTAQEAMDRLAGEMDELMARMQAADEANDAYSGCGPRLNEPREADYWINEVEGAPWPPLENEKPQGVTVAYEEIIQRWAE